MEAYVAVSLALALLMGFELLMGVLAHRRIRRLREMRKAEGIRSIFAETLSVELARECAGLLGVTGGEQHV